MMIDNKMIDNKMSKSTKNIVLKKNRANLIAHEIENDVLFDTEKKRE